MNSAVVQAIEEIKASFPESPVSHNEDGHGGAWVFIENVDPGPIYENRKVWVGADIGGQYPYSDIYPVFISGELRRVDGKPLGDAISPNIGFHGRTANQISRRSNNRNPSIETAAMKIQKVLLWLAKK